MIHICTPFRLDKDLGRAYNETMALIGEDDWACLMDWDCSLLTHEQIKYMHKYIELYPDALLTAYTNRIHQVSQQLDKNPADFNDYGGHIKRAHEYSIMLYEVEPIYKNLSGFLMLISKRMWNEFEFKEGIGCLGVDTDYWRRLVAAKQPILIMKGIYVFHQYRYVTGNKNHLL